MCPRSSPTAAEIVVDVRAGRFLADHIPGARFVELAGEDHSPFGAGADKLVEATGGFLSELHAGSPAPERDRILSTILFTDIVGSTARAAELGDARWHDLLERHHGAIMQELARYR